MFGRDIHDFTHQPVGLIESCWGGTRIHSWISLETLATMPEKVSATRGAVNFRDHYDEIKHTYETVTLPQWKATLEKWNQDNKAALDAFAAEQKQWGQLAREAAAQKMPAPPKPRGPKPPREPVDPIHNNQTSCALFNGMIASIIPYGIKGAIWYQGESNALEPIPYRAEVPALINDWRKHWGQGDFSFLLVQLPNFMASKPEPGESSWAATREAQDKALALPNTGVAVTIDVGEAGNIHPSDKADVSHRLALAARQVAYGQKEDTGLSPLYKSFKIEGNKVRITFDHAGVGLAIGTPPRSYFWISRKETRWRPRPLELQGFAVAGADHKFVWATAPPSMATPSSSKTTPSPTPSRFVTAGPTTPPATSTPEGRTASLALPHRRLPLGQIKRKFQHAFPKIRTNETARSSGATTSKSPGRSAGKGHPKKRRQKQRLCGLPPKRNFPSSTSSSQRHQNRRRAILCANAERRLRAKKLLNNISCHSP